MEELKTITEERIEELDELDSWLQYQAEQEDYIEDTSTKEGLEIYNAHIKSINKLRQMIKILKLDIKLYNRWIYEVKPESIQHAYYFGKLTEVENIIDSVKYYDN